MAGGDESGPRPAGAAAPPPPPPPGTKAGGLSKNSRPQPEPQPSASRLLSHPPRKRLQPQQPASGGPQAQPPPPATGPVAPPTRPSPQATSSAPPRPTSASPPSSDSPTSRPDTDFKPSSSASAPGPFPASSSSSSSSSSSDGSAPGSGNKSGDLPDPHPHFFQRNEKMRQWQPMIEDTERWQAYRGVTDDSGGGVSGRRPAQWSFLFDTPGARLLAAVTQPLRAAARSLLFGGLLARLQNNAEAFIREEVEHDFDAKEFLEGVQEAVPAFFDALAAGDDQALRRMASAKVVEAVDRDRQRLRDDLRLEVRSVTATINGAAVGGANLWGPDSIHGFDSDWVAQSAPGMSRSWLTMVVHLDVSLNVVYHFVAGGSGSGSSGGGESGDGAKQGGGKDGGDGEPRTVQDALVGVEMSRVVRRTGSWLMARGPLPQGAVRSLESSWKIVGWW